MRAGNPRGARPLLVAQAVLFAALGLSGCEAMQFSADASGSESITLDRQTVVRWNGTVDARIGNHREPDTILVDYELTVTASATERAERLAADFAVQSATGDDGALELSVPTWLDAGLRGTVEIFVPQGMHIQARQASGTLWVESAGGHVEVLSAGPVRVRADRDIDVRTSAGNALVDTEARVGARVSVASERGDVQIGLPREFSARLFLQSAGALVVDHPAISPSLVRRNALEATIGAVGGADVRGMAGGRLVVVVSE